jgi:hypothetical protein
LELQRRLREVIHRLSDVKKKSAVRMPFHHAAQASTPHCRQIHEILAYFCYSFRGEMWGELYGRERLMLP